MNVDGTQNLLDAAIEEGVRMFIFISSIKVNGEFTSTHPFSANSRANRLDPYGQSKPESEVAVENICHESGRDWAIIVSSP